MNILLIEKKANAFRNQVGISANDCIRLKSLLIKLDVLTVFKPLNSGLSGMAIKIAANDTFKRFILVNSNHSLAEQHLTICHELYHLYIQEEFKSQICIVGKFDRKTDIEEYNADVFGAFLLLPEAGIKSIIPDNELTKNKLSLKTLLKLEQYFSCPREVVLHQLIHHGIVDKEHAKNFSADTIHDALVHGYNTDIYIGGNHNTVIGDYGVIAKDLLDFGKISESHYHELLLDLGMNTDEYEKLINIPE